MSETQSHKSSPYLFSLYIMSELFLTRTTSLKLVESTLCLLRSSCRTSEADPKVHPLLEGCEVTPRQRKSMQMPGRWCYVRSGSVLREWIVGNVQFIKLVVLTPLGNGYNNRFQCNEWFIEYGKYITKVLNYNFSCVMCSLWIVTAS